MQILQLAICFYLRQRMANVSVQCESSEQADDDDGLRTVASSAIAFLLPGATGTCYTVLAAGNMTFQIAFQSTHKQCIAQA